MAYTSQHQIYCTVQRAVDYIIHDNKTGNGKYVDSYRCSPCSAETEFDITKIVAKEMIGDYATPNGENTLAYHFIQSFKPGEVSAETALEIGKKFCDKYLKGEYQYIIATHTDTVKNGGSIHNHIIFNSTNNVTYRKFRSSKYLYRKTQKLSDELCREYQLNIISEKGGNSEKWYKEYMEEIKGIQHPDSYRKILKDNIDSAIDLSPSYGVFLSRMKEAGYKIKSRSANGEWLKNVSYRGNGSQRFIRDTSLGEGYLREEIIKRIFIKSKEVNDIISSSKTITINISKLVLSEDDNKIFTRLPGFYSKSAKYFLLDKEKFQIMKIHNGKTFKIILPDNYDLNVYNRSGIQIGEINTRDIFNIYNDANKNRIDNLKNKYNLLDITNLNKKLPFSMDNRIKFMIRNQHVYNVNIITEALNVVKNENIKCNKDMYHKLVELNELKQVNQDRIIEMKEKYLAQQDKLKFLYVYDKSNTGNDVQTDNFKYDNLAEFSKTMLHKENVSFDTSVIEFEESVVELQNELNKLYEIDRKIDNRIISIEKAQDTIYELFNSRSSNYEKVKEYERSK